MENKYEVEKKERKPLKLEDSNMALAGSELHKKIRAESAEDIEAFKGAGKKKGLEVWRVERMKMKRYPRDMYGVFFSGDSYLILQSVGTEESLEHEIFFWIGMESSGDEYGTVAIRACSLDALLGFSPVQHREVEGNESTEFLGLWGKENATKDFEVREGGVASGFQKATAIVLPTRLFHMRSSGGILNTKMFQVPVTVESLNEDDTFLLDCDRDLFLFQGATTSAGERALGSRTATKISQNRERACKTRVVTSEDAPEEFWKHLGIESGKRPDKIKEQPDAEGVGCRKKSVYRITDTEGGKQCKIFAVAEKVDKVPFSLFESDDAFVLDTGAEVFVWIGSKTSKAEKEQSMFLAQDYLNSKKRPPNTPITRVCEGRESAAFKALVVKEE